MKRIISILIFTCLFALCLLGTCGCFHMTNLSENTETTYQSISQGVEDTTVAESSFNSMQTTILPEPKVQANAEPIEKSFHINKLDQASAHLRDEKDKGKVYPLFAYDKNYLVLQRENPKTGTLSELILLNLNTDEETSIFALENPYDSIQPVFPKEVKSKPGVLRFSVSHEKAKDAYYSFTIATKELQPLEEMSVVVPDAPDNQRYIFRENTQSKEYPWELYDQSEKQVLLQSNYEQYVKNNGENGLLNIDLVNRTEIFACLDGTLYVFPQKVGDEGLLSVQLATDGTLFVFSGNKPTVYGISPVYVADTIWRLEK